jgi:hypothetical protein
MGRSDSITGALMDFELTWDGILLVAFLALGFLIEVLVLLVLLLVELLFILIRNVPVGICQQQSLLEDARASCAHAEHQAGRTTRPRCAPTKKKTRQRRRRTPDSRSAGLRRDAPAT